MRAIAAPGMHDLPAHQVDHRNHLEGQVGGVAVHIHVFEFIGGGGMNGVPIPASLLREGDLMLNALIADLLQVPGVRISYSRDARLPALDGVSLRQAQIVRRDPKEDSQTALLREIRAADAVWPVAPETGGELERVARTVLAAGRVLMGAHPDAIAAASSKFATWQCLRRAGVCSPPVYRHGDQSAQADGPWVVKPDDGAGCLHTRKVDGWSQAMAALRSLGPGFIAQPWAEGEAMSLSVIGHANGVQVLSVNRQGIEERDGLLQFRAVDVNAGAVTRPLLEMARSVASAISGLIGYFGIDYVQNTRGPVVIEVNPRLTTSYAGLRKARAVNAAKLVLDSLVPSAQPSSQQHIQKQAPGRTVRLDLAQAIDG
jgi:tyramine---L-glutamate ligase